MTAISWKLSGSGLWNVAGNWMPAQIPGVSDIATIGISGATVTSSANVTVGSTIVDDNATLAVDGGTTFQTFQGSTEQLGTIFVYAGGNLEIGKDATTETFDNAGTIYLAPGSATTSLTIAGNLTISGSSSTSGILADYYGGTPSTISITGDGVGSPALTLSNTENIILGAGSLSVSGLTLTLDSGAAIFAGGGQLTINTGTNTVTNNAGDLEAVGSGELVLDSPVNNANGFIVVGGGDYGYEGGSIVIAARVTGTSGTVDLAGYGMMELASGGSIPSTLQMLGSTGNTIRLDTGTNQLGNGISGAVAGDNIDLAFAPFTSGDQAVWNQTSGAAGTLSLVNGSTTLAALNLAGQYNSADFNALSDGHGGSLIELVTPGQSSATTAVMIMQSGGGGSFAVGNENYEIYDIGNNAILSANPLELVASNSQTAAAYFNSSTAKFQIVGLGGFSGGDTSDILMRDAGSDSAAGTFSIFDTSNNNASGGMTLGQVGSEWQVAGLGDFSTRAGETDMLMRDSNNGALEVYDISNNAITFAGPMGQIGLEWQFSGFGDFSGHAGETDMLMRDSNTGAFELYDISNNTITSATGMGQVGLEWSVAGFGDFSSNANETDMLMRNNTTGAFEIYDISNNQIASAAPMGQVGLEWQVAGFGPLDGAGTSDMLMRNTNTGAFELYDIANSHLTNAVSMGQVGSAWSVAGIAA